MSSWPLNGKKGGNRKHSKIDTLPPEMKATVEEMIMDGSATYSDIVAYLEQQGYSLSVSSVCRYAQGYVENLQTLQIAQANFPQYAGRIGAVSRSGHHRGACACCKPKPYDRADL